MNARLVLLLCGTFLIAVAPVCRADRAPSFGHAQTTPAIQVSPRTFGYSIPERNAPGSLRLMAGLFATETGAHMGIIMGDIDSRSFIYSDSHKDGWLFGDEGNHNRKHRRDNGDPTAVPESGTLGYLLIGLVAVGLWNFRRSAPMRPI